MQGSPQCYERARTQQDRNPVAPPCLFFTHECHQDPQVSDKSTWMPSLPSQALDSEDGSSESSTFSQSKTGDIPEECRFLLNTQVMFLKKEKRPTTKIIDDHEWTRSLTEAQAITADIPEELITHNQSEVDPKKVRPIQMGEFL